MSPLAELMDGQTSHLIHAHPTDYPQTIGTVLRAGTRSWYEIDYDASDGTEAMAALLRIHHDDIVRALPAAEQGDPEASADLERELGNLIVSGLRWATAYVANPLTCIEAAEQAQRDYAAREGR